MKRFFFIHILVIGLSLLPVYPNGHSSYYLYSDRAININDRSFNLYVLPQLKALDKEYYHLLRKLNPLNDTLIAIKLSIIEMILFYKNSNKNCVNNESDCLKVMQKLYQQSRKLDQNLLKLLDKQLTFGKKDIQEVTHLLSLSKSIDEIMGHNYRLMHQLEQYNLAFGTSFHKFSSGRTKIPRLFHLMDMASENILTTLLSPPLQNEFNFVRSTFFKNIEKYIIQNKNKKHLINQLEQLNMAWNTFHMKMTKGNHRPNKDAQKLIKLMHNRWNSVLKIVLRN